MPESHYSFDVSSDQFPARVLEASSQVPVLVDCWAAWCGPCQTLKPMLEALAEDYHGAFLLAKVDTEKEQALAAGDLEQLQRQTEANPGDHNSRLQLADTLVRQGDYPTAMEQLLQMLGRDDGLAHQRILTIFDLIDDAAQVSDYRRRLFNALH